MRWWQLVSCVIQEMCLFSIKYVAQSGRKVVCPLWHWQSGIRPADGIAIHPPAPTGQRSGGENCGPGKSHTGWHLSKQFKTNSCEYPLCSHITHLHHPLALRAPLLSHQELQVGLGGNEASQAGLEESCAQLPICQDLLV